ncbi:hypothetical protein ACH5RR_012167 [Cinchona calisaya]|uniref:Cyclin N-terminal domain-containing protein n=1 Tax=Cinchona calisaya TaxID=153742 RepID=A0ABD3A6Z1_9GENT
MADKSFACVASNLLCSEAKSLCFDDSENVSIITDEKGHQSNDKALGFGNGRSEPLIALPCLTDEKFSLMVEEEKSHLPKNDYLMRLREGEIDMSVRRQALDWILKAHAHYGFGELALYLAMNYFDRFLSLFELPKDKTWTMQLLAVACLSLGVKMAEITIPLVVDLQVGDPKVIFEANTIRRMEILVLSKLKWRMHSYTPYTFIDYFLRKISGHDDHQISFEELIGKAVKLILSTIKVIDFLEFKPSEIAAAVAIFVAGETQAVDTEKAMSCFILVEKDRVVKCHKLLKDLTLMMLSGSTNTTNMASESVALVVPHSPYGVLEVACLSYKSGDEITVGSCPNSSNTTTDTKRKKLDTTASSLVANSQK